MKDGFIKVAALTPDIKVADPVANRESISAKMKEAYEHGARVLVFPELCLCGYTCNDLFLQELMLTSCLEQAQILAEETKDRPGLVFVGLPLSFRGKLYNVAAVLGGGRILCFIPKRNIPNYAEFYEARHFTPGPEVPVMVPVGDTMVPMGTDILLQAVGYPELSVACEICEDVWVPDSPGIRHAMAGATIVVNLSGSNETVGKESYRKMLVQATSAKLVAGYVYSTAGLGESTQDLVFGGHNMIADNGIMLAEAKLYANETIYGDIDLHRLIHERRRMTTYAPDTAEYEYEIIPFVLPMEETRLERFIDPMPFVPSGKAERELRCEQILAIQSQGLRKRYEHTRCQYAILGISGGLDSTLALLVTARAFDLLGLPREQIIAVTMPGFGTTDRTYDNACKLTKTLGATLYEVDIREAVTLHFRDIGQDINVHDVTYENGQARERTQVLMDLANRLGGMVIGTGDMSELALGWATYNGDHMSMYGVNVGIPKTLVRHLVRYYADTCGEKVLEEVLLDVLDTPVSPELLPPVDGKISQMTEDLVGPYELHDFFLYHMLRCGAHPAKIFRLAQIAFDGVYDREVILKWQKTFFRRYFAQQFKRSCLPDGPKVGSVAVSPRGDLRMPSDATARIWLEEIEKL